MNSNDYLKTISVKCNISEAYKAITHGYSNWWTQCTGSFRAKGDRITFRFPPQESYWTFEAVELSEKNYVLLKCVEAHHIILDKPAASRTEWLNSYLKFQIQKNGNV